MKKYNFKSLLEYALMAMVCIIFVLLVHRVGTGFWLFDTARAPVSKVEPLTDEEFEPIYQMTTVYRNNSVKTTGTLRELRIEKCLIEKEMKQEYEWKTHKDSLVKQQIKLLEQLNCK